MLLEAIASILAPLQEKDRRPLLQTALNPGLITRQPDYKAQKIVREYRLARETIIAAIEEKLQRSNPKEVN